MLNSIEKLRREPERKKKRVALLFSAVFTIGVFSLWLFMTLNAPDIETNERMQGPASGLVENFNAGVREIVRIVKNAF